MKYPKFMTMINKACGYISGAIILGASFLAVMESILRKVFLSPTRWSLNLTQGVFIWAAFLGASWALQEVGHVSIDMIRDVIDKHTKGAGRMPRRIIAICSYLACGFVLFVMLRAGWNLSLRAIQFNEYAAYNFKFPKIISYSAIVTGTVLMLLTIVFIILDLIKGNDKYLA
ncbi:MAG: TRAP transporter small permease subunit [Clostridiales bacterium]|nr:TRAP transporter small permease subunit [Clostridiales bacterium]